MSKYMVNGTDLTNIADIIRERDGLNLYDPVANIGYVRPGVKYVFSKYVTFDGNTKAVHVYYLYDASGSFITGGSYMLSSKPAAGSILRASLSFTAPENAAYVVNYPMVNTCPETDIQLEIGSSPSDYNAYQKIEYPDEFINKIGDLVNTSSATAAAGDIRYGTTAYVNGNKIYGSLHPLDTSDATAVAADIRSGSTAYVNGSKVTGTARMFDEIKMTWFAMYIYKFFDEPVTFSTGEIKTFETTYDVQDGVLLQSADSLPIYTDNGSTYSDPVITSNFTLTSTIAHPEANTVTVTFSLKNMSGASRTIFYGATQENRGWIRQQIKYYIPLVLN